MRAEQAAAKGFVPGILSPTEVLVQAPGVAGQPAALAWLQRALARQPGVAGVLGPATLPNVQRGLGILIDTFVVRSLLVPALVVLFGQAGSWPGRTVRPVHRPAGSPAAEDLQGAVAHRD